MEIYKNLGFVLLTHYANGYTTKELCLHINGINFIFNKTYMIILADQKENCNIFHVFKNN